MGRRWMWIFFRVETEWVRNTGSGSAFGGNGVLGMGMEDGVLLGDMYGKDEDD